MPMGMVTSDASPMRQSSAKMTAMMPSGTSRFAVISGTTCASVVSMLSTFSTMMFLSLPEGVSST